jgi:hypothetical protein
LKQTFEFYGDQVERKMTAFKFVLAVVAAAVLGGCGTYVPDTQDFPGNTGDQHLLVQAVVQSVHCEVENAIFDLYRQAGQYPAMRPVTKALDNWGLQMTLSLKTEEKGTLNPTVVWSPPSPVTAIFSLAGTATLSSDAIRTDKLYFYYRVKDLKNRHCPTGIQPYAPVSSPLIQTNLKFGDWLYDVLIPAGTGEITLPTSPSGPLKQNVIYYEVSFEVTTTGSITPSWKFKHVTVNPTGTLAAALRDRTHDLQITMGPGDDKGLQGTAATAQLSGDVGLSVANNIRRIIEP